MPVRSGAVTFARFEVERPPRGDTKRWLARSLQRKAFQPLDVARGDEDRSAGFVELERQEAGDFGDVLAGAYALFAWRVDAIRVPASALKQDVARWAAEFEAAKGRPPGRRERADRKEAVRQKLRQQAEPVTRVHDVSWNLEQGRIAIWAASRKAVEEIAAAVEEAFEVELAPLGPGAVAARGGVPEAALAPTPALVGPELVGPELGGRGGGDGQA